MSTKCDRCQGLMVEGRYMDELSGMFYFEGAKCVNCGCVVFEFPGTKQLLRVGKGRYVRHNAPVRV